MNGEYSPGATWDLRAHERNGFSNLRSNTSLGSEFSGRAGRARRSPSRPEVFSVRMNGRLRLKVELALWGIEGGGSVEEALKMDMARFRRGCLRP